MKKLICILLSFTLLLSCNPLTANASENTVTETIDYLADGSYFTTSIEVEPNNNLISMFSTTSTVTAKKNYDF